MANPDDHRVYLCGRLCVRIGRERLEEQLPARQGRLVFGYLAVNRARWVGRDELLEVLWPDEPPAAAESALAALLAKIRRVLGADAIAGRHELQLALPPGTWIDLEAAREALHRAESAVAGARWADAWGPARVASHICARGFLKGLASPWADAMRTDLQQQLVRAQECVAASSLGIGGGEIATAHRAARALVRLAPLRESGYRALMQALARDDNHAEALAVYEQLRRLVRNELGSVPSPATRRLHMELLQASRPVPASDRAPGRPLAD